jgi:hypothetical protein
MLLQTKQHRKESSTKQKQGSFANTSLSTATCKIYEIHRISSKKNGFQLGMLHIPNLTKTQGQCQSIFCFAMSKCRMAVENSSWYIVGRTFLAIA